MWCVKEIPPTMGRFFTTVFVPIFRQCFAVHLPARPLLLTQQVLRAMVRALHWLLPVPTTGSAVYYDAGSMDGLCVIVTYGGTKTYYAYMKFQGVPRRVKIARVGQMKLIEARNESAYSKRTFPAWRRSVGRTA